MNETGPSRRQSIYIDGYSHANPVPAAARIDQFVFSGAITGRDPETHEMPKDLDAQCVNLFVHVRKIVEAAGGTTDDIVKMTVWLSDFRSRDALNREWEKLFPDPTNRPARHAIAATFDGDMQVQCDLIAILPTH